MSIGVVPNAAAAGPYLVKDIATGISEGRGSEPVRYIPGPQSRQFITRSSHLWVTDGDEEGASLVYVFSGGEDWLVSDALDVNGISYIATDTRLWRSDGTREGCFPIMTGEVFALAEFQGSLYFVASTTSQGLCLFRSDGSCAGTVPVAILSIAFPDGVEILTGKDSLWIAVELSGSPYDPYTYPHPVTIWRSDGTGLGTRYVLDLDERARLTAFQDTLFYISYESKDETDALYRIERDDREPKMVVAGADGGRFRGIYGDAATDDAFYFMAEDSTGLASLYRADRSMPTAIPVWSESAFATVPSFSRSGSRVPSWSDRSSGFVALNSGLIFDWFDEEHGWELWGSDGTSEGTRLLKDIWPGPDRSDINYMTSAHGRVYFSAFDAIHGYELWSTDGTSEGTTMARDIFPGGSSYPGLLTIGNGGVYFPANDGIHGFELWRSDGTPDGTRLVKDASPAGSDSSYPAQIRALGNGLVLSARTTATGRDLWRSDGTPQGTVLVQDIYPGNPDSSILTENRGEATWRNLCFFLATDGLNGQEVWRTDATPEGTFPIVRLAADRLYASTLEFFPSPDSGASFYFTHETPDGKRQTLYCTDGTSEGTAALKIGLFSPLHPLGDDVLFGYRSDPSNYSGSLWRTDSAHGSAIPIKDPFNISYYSPTIPPAYPDSLLLTTREFPGRVDLWRVDVSGWMQRAGYFPDWWSYTHVGRIKGQDLLVGQETNNLYSVGTTNGLPSGTRRVKVLPPPGTTDLVDALQGEKGLPTFIQSDGHGTSELCVTDGTADGTGLLCRWPAPTYALHYLRGLDGVTVFVLRDGTHGTELWASDGTSAGTGLLRDINPGPLGSDIMILLQHEGLIFFSANDGATGPELWVTDGTPLGTVRLTDIAPGIVGSEPEGLCLLGDTLYFSAFGGDAIDRELWALPLADLPFPSQIERDILPRILNQPGAPAVGDQNADASLDIADFIRARAER